MHFKDGDPTTPLCQLWDCHIQIFWLLQPLNASPTALRESVTIMETSDYPKSLSGIQQNTPKLAQNLITNPKSFTKVYSRISPFASSDYGAGWCPSLKTLVILVWCLPSGTSPHLTRVWWWRQCETPQKLRELESKSLPRLSSQMGIPAGAVPLTASLH